MIDLIVLLLCLAGFGLLLIALPRHQQDWMRRKLTAAVSRHCRQAGFAFTGLALLLSVADEGWARGTVIWVGWLTAAAMIVVTVQMNRERILRVLRP